MGRRMRTEYCLSPYWSSGEDLQGDHAPTGLENINGNLTSFDMELLEAKMQLKIDLSGECWLRIALRTHGAC